MIVSVGDLVDRGPDSARVVRRFREGARAGTHKAVLGNHEQLMLGAIEAYAPHLLRDADCGLHPAVEPMTTVWSRRESGSARWLPQDVYCWYRTLAWLAQGGSPTLGSWGTASPTEPATWRVDPEDLRFLNQLPLVFRTESVVVTHALATDTALQDLTTDDAETRARAAQALLWNRRPPATPADADRINVSGHSIVDRVRRRPTRRLVQVDTGACMGRRLSAWCAETDRVISVPA